MFQQFARDGNRDAGAGIEGLLRGAERAPGDADFEGGGWLAAQNGEGVKEVGPLQLHRGNLGLGGRELGFGLGDIEVGGDTTLAAVLGEFERTAVGDHGFLQQLVLGIERAQGEVVNGDFGLDGELGGFEIIGRGSHTRARALDLAAHAAPDIELPTGIERDDEGVESGPVAGGAGAGRLVGANALAGEGGVGRELGEEVGARDVHKGAGLLEVRIGGRELLVVGGREGFEAVQIGVAEEFPPGAARQVGGGLGRLPNPRVSRTCATKGRRHGVGAEGRRPLVVRADGAAGQRGDDRY